MTKSVTQTVVVHVNTGGGGKEKKGKGKKGEGRMPRGGGGGRMGRGSKRGPTPSQGPVVLSVPQMPPIPLFTQTAPSKQSDFAEQFVKILGAMAEGVPAIKDGQIAPQITLNNPNVAGQLASIQHQQGRPSALAIEPSISGMNTLSSALSGVATPATVPPTAPTSPRTEPISYVDRRSISDKSTGLIKDTLSQGLSAIASSSAMPTLQLPSSSLPPVAKLPPQASVSQLLVGSAKPATSSTIELKLPRASEIQPQNPRSVKRPPKPPKPSVPSMSIDA